LWGGCSQRRACDELRLPSGSPLATHTCSGCSEAPLVGFQPRRSQAERALRSVPSPEHLCEHICEAAVSQHTALGGAGRGFGK
jgi:hypothetical protein